VLLGGELKLLTVIMRAGAGVGAGAGAGAGSGGGVSEDTIRSVKFKVSEISVLYMYYTCIIHVLYMYYICIICWMLLRLVYLLATVVVSVCRSS
jgi:hypothetical protein